MDDERYDWQVKGLCRGVEPEVFFPIAEEDAWRAKEICHGCRVREQCLAFSLTNRERYGVWAESRRKSGRTCGAEESRKGF